MSSEQSTTLENKLNILSEIWVMYRDEEDFADFIEYNDLGLPLAYLASTGIVEVKSEKALAFINETFSLLLSGVGVEDTGYETLDEILGNE
jgi:hypothetical protein